MATATDTVRKLLKPGALGQSVAPVGTLADFLEVSGEHEGVVDEFLREELNYVVVESWGAAEEGVRVLKTSDGRATFLVHSDAQGELFASNEEPMNEPGITPLNDAIKVLNGFGRSLEGLLPKLKHGYLVENAIDAQRLALRYGHAYFLTPEGECFHRVDGDGRQAGERGPSGAEARVARDRDAGWRNLERGACPGGKRSGGADPRHRGIDRATGDARRRAPAGRERRSQPGRGPEADGSRDPAHRAAAAGVAGAGGDATRTRAKPSSKPSPRSAKRRRGSMRNTRRRKAAWMRSRRSWRALRQKREALQQEAAQMTAELAGLEERRRGAEAAFQRIDRLHADLERRVLAIEQQRAAADAEREQRIAENADAC